MKFMSPENVKKLIERGEIDVEYSFFESMPNGFDPDSSYTLDFGNVDDGRRLTFYGCRVVRYTEQSVTLSLKNPKFILKEESPDVGDNAETVGGDL